MIDYDTVTDDITEDQQVVRALTQGREYLWGCQWDLAIQFLNQFVTVQHDVDAYILLGRAYLFKGDLYADEAAKQFRMAVSLDSKRASAYYYLGYALWTKKELKEALAAFRQSQKLKPSEITQNYISTLTKLLAK